MDYDCTLASIDRLSVDTVGIRYPLCHDCKTPDCSNPIREKTVSILGVPRKVRLYVVNNIAKQVVACRGYVGNVSISTVQTDLEIKARPIQRDGPADQEIDTSTEHSEEEPF